MENKKRKFTPLNNYVLIRKEEVGVEIEKDGFVTGKVKTETTIPEGTVIEKDVNIIEIDFNDRVVFSPHESYGFIYNGEECVISNFGNIFGKWEQ